MTTSNGAAAGLSTDEIAQIRAGLAAGRKPKVVFTSQAGQIAGQTGQVVRLADPAESDEWVVVRFGRDELPFSPADLGLPVRGRAGKAETEPKPGAATQAAAHAAALEQPAVPTPRPAPEPAPAPAAKPAKRAARPARPKSPPAMTVTLAYEAGEWTVGAHQGSKTLAKPYVIRAADALKMVALLDVPGVHDAVAQIVETERTEAQQRAEALRGELAEVEARLAELRDASA